MNQKQLNILSEKIQPVFIKERKGGGGITLNYVEAAFVIQRLNEAFGGNWSFSIGVPFERQSETGKTEVIVDGTITIHDKDFPISKSQFGSVVVQKGMEIGDTYKGAASDSLKKCATLLGLGLELYGTEYALKPKLDQSLRANIKKKITSSGKDFTELNKDFTDIHGYSMFVSEADVITEWLDRP